MTALLLPLPEGAVLSAPPPDGLLLAAQLPARGESTSPVGLAVAERPLPPPPDGTPLLAGLHAWLVARTTSAGQVEVVPTPLGTAAAAVDVLDGPVTAAVAVLPLGDRLLIVTAGAAGDEAARVAGVVAAALSGLQPAGPEVCQEG